MKLKDVLAAKGSRVVTVSAKSSVADAIRTMCAEKVGAVLVPDAEGCPIGIAQICREVSRITLDGRGIATVLSPNPTAERDCNPRPRDYG